MQINNLSINNVPSIYYDQGFRNVLESFMSFLRNDKSTYVISIEPSVSYKYEFDFYGLLTANNIPAHLHWIVLRMNRFTSPTDAGNKVSGLLIPDASIIEQIRQSHMSTRRI